MRVALKTAAIVVVALGVLGACSSGGSKSKTTTTTTTTTNPADTGPDITSFVVPANVDCNRGAIEVSWTTRDTKDVALFVDSVQVASGPYGKGSDTLTVTCDGKEHRIGIEAIGANGQTVSDWKMTKTTASPTPTSSPTPTTTTPNPTGCVSQGLLLQMLGQYTVRSGQQGVTAKSAQCAGNYVAVTFGLPNGTAKGLFIMTGVQVTLVGLPTVGGAAPGYLYQNCQLDATALSTLALPALVPTGGKGVQNCGPSVWGVQ